MGYSSSAALIIWYTYFVTNPNPSFFMVAGARNHLPANRPLKFSFEIAT